MSRTLRRFPSKLYYCWDVDFSNKKVERDGHYVHVYIPIAPYDDDPVERWQVRKNRINTANYVCHRRAGEVTLDWNDWTLDRCFYHRARRRMNKVLIQQGMEEYENAKMTGDSLIC